MVGGVAALAGVIVLGPRLGKYDKKGKATPIPGHHLPMAVLGTLVLGFGWFGFNTGSTMSGNDLRIGAVCVNTMLASCVAGMAAMFYMKLATGKWDVGMTCNGYLAGLVAITAPCAFVNIWGAFAVGLVAGILVCVSCSFVENKLKLDDPVGAISVHGVNGAWGVISLGIFADGSYGDGLNGVAGKVKGLIMGDTGQFKAQLLGTLTCFVFVFSFFYLFFKITDKIWGIRVSEKVETEGLDVPDCGSNAYPEFQLHK
jgi:Amt family ammonium transporter